VIKRLATEAWFQLTSRDFALWEIVAALLASSPSTPGWVSFLIIFAWLLLRCATANKEAA
jgi:hypothetical protein